MKNSRATYPLSYQLFNALGRLLVAARLPAVRLDEQTVCAAALQRTGLTDFGAPHYRQGLLRLLESAEEDANLHPIGRYIIHSSIVAYLAQRLRLVEARKKETEIFRRPLLPPIIIVGMARSGTTFLHNMLALDPAHRALPLWLLGSPFPGGPGNGAGPDPRLAKTEQALRFRQPLLPGLDSIHYVRADSYEECILALGLTFNSLIFWVLYPVYGYFDWYLHQDDTAQKYREYRWLLQVFQSYEPERRLTLKAPAHAGNLDAILDALPNALVIQTHRDPVACVSSANSLLHTYHLAVADEIDVRRMADMTLGGYEVSLRSNVAFRTAHPGVIHDVFYDSLVSDPIGTLRGIYAL